MANPLPTFQVILDPEGEGGSLRYQNAPGEVQRRHLVDRGNSLVVQGELVDVVHGRLSPLGDDGTIIITDFHFIPSKNSRRFKNAAVTLRFKSDDPAAADVEVLDSAPKGHHSLLATTETVELTKSANANIAAGTVVTAGAGLGWELKHSTEKKHQTTLSGSIRLEGRPYGGKNTVRWTISENPSQKTGIPTMLRTAVLLRRKQKQDGDAVKFLAEVDIRCSVDFVSSLEEGVDSLVGRIPRDDPVIFDPTQPPTTTTFDIEELAKQNLTTHCAVLTTTMLHGTVGDSFLNAKSSC